jgi:choice-of-anchor B domain-containing protein
MRRLLLAITFSLSFVAIKAQNNYNLSQLSTLSIGDNGYANIWGYAQNGKEYALLGCTGSQTLTDACAIIDVTNSASPATIFRIPGPQSTWREIRTYGHYAYITTEAASTDFGVTIVDLQYLPDSIRTKQWSGNGAFGNVHALHIDNGYMYLYGSQNSLSLGGALIVSLTDPWNPTIVGAYNTRYIHDGTVLNNKMYAGEIFNGTFSIVDVTNKSAPVVLNTQITPSSFTHNTWLSSDNKTLYTTDEVADAFVAAYNVENTGNITELDRYKRANSGGAIPHNTYVLNNPAVTGNNSDYVHTSYYTQGVTIVDATNPNNLVEVAHYDTNPLTGSGYEGVWGVYPYLPSGNLLVSDMQLGLFVLDPTYTRAAYVEGEVKDKNTNLPIPNASVKLLANGLSKQGKLDGTYKIGYALAGLHTIRYSAPGYKTIDVPTNFINATTLTQVALLEPGTTGIDDKEFENINVFPNTFVNHINIENKNLQKFNASIIDVNGRLLKNLDIQDNINKIQLDNLAGGIYILQLSNHNFSKQYKLIKQ